MFRSEREAMHFYASPVVAWFLPAASGLTIGGFIAAVFSLVSWRFFSDAQPFNTFLIVMFIVAIPIWCYLTFTTWGKIGLAPQRQIKVLKLVIDENGGKKLTKKEFESVDDGEFIDICRFIILDGGTLAIRQLRSLGLSENQVIKFRRELVGERMAVYDTNGEVKLTPSGKKYMTGFAPYPAGGGEDD